MSERELEACQRKPEESHAVAPDASHEPAHAPQQLELARSGRTFDCIFQGKEDAIVDAFSIAQSGGKATMGFGLMTALKAFPGLRHRIERYAWGVIVHLYKKLRGGGEGTHIESVRLFNGTSRKAQVKAINEALAREKARAAEAAEKLAKQRLAEQKAEHRAAKKAAIERWQEDAGQEHP